ncbi:Uncharacterised protein [Mycobacteroides abscessus subsp. abscessus]|nr:Uncharacterised protein [Mycobacteroides abscessus subsp. abscessus]
MQHLVIVCTYVGAGRRVRGSKRLCSVVVLHGASLNGGSRARTTGSCRRASSLWQPIWRFRDIVPDQAISWGLLGVILSVSITGSAAGSSLAWPARQAGAEAQPAANEGHWRRHLSKAATLEAICSKSFALKPDPASRVACSRYLS